MSIESKGQFSEFCLHLGFTIGALTRDDVTERLKSLQATDEEIKAARLALWKIAEALYRR